MRDDALERFKEAVEKKQAAAGIPNAVLRAIKNQDFAPADEYVAGMLVDAERITGALEAVRHQTHGSKRPEVNAAINAGVKAQHALGDFYRAFQTLIGID